MRFASFCTGIGAPEVAWPFFAPTFFSEVDPHCNALLAHHYPKVTNLGDMTQIDGREWRDTVDLVVAGTPCQSFSVAGLRKGMDDPRGNLTLVYLRLLERMRPRWMVWENVPGILSIDGGRAFGAFLGGLAELGYGFAYRVLDAQFFGVPQRRRRVFVVGYLGDWRRAAAVLLEPESLCGHPAPRREKGERVAGTVKGGVGERGYPDPSDGNGGGLISCPLTSNPYGDHESREWLLVMAHGQAGAEDDFVQGDIYPKGQPIAFSCKDDGGDTGEASPPLRAMGHDESHANAGGQVAVAFTQNTREEVRDLKDCAGALSSEPGTHQTTYVAFGFNGDQSEKTHSMGEHEEQCPMIRSDGPAHVAQVQWASGGGQVENPTAQALRSGAEYNYQFLRQSMSVRRLTPRECERLQGFPDDYTLIPYKGKPMADGPRYKMLGNSMAVPVVRWIGERIMECDK